MKRLSVSLRSEVAETLRRSAAKSGKPISHVIEDALIEKFKTCHKA